MLKSGPILKRINLIIIFLFLLILILISFNIWAYMEYKAFLDSFPSASNKEILFEKVNCLNFTVNAITIILVFNIIIFIYTLILHKKWIKIRMEEIEKYSISSNVVKVNEH